MLNQQVEASCRIKRTFVGTPKLSWQYGVSLRKVIELPSRVWKLR